MSARNITKYLNDTSPNEGKNERVGISFFQTVLLTLFVTTSVILFSALAYYLVKKRALKKMRHYLVPLYHFDTGECDNWEDELLEDSLEGKRIAAHQSKGRAYTHTVCNRWAVHFYTEYQWLVSKGHKKPKYALTPDVLYFVARGKALHATLGKCFYYMSSCLTCFKGHENS